MAKGEFGLASGDLPCRGLSLQPFLFIAAISASRCILAIGAQVSEAGFVQCKLLADWALICCGGMQVGMGLVKKLALKGAR